MKEIYIKMLIMLKLCILLYVADTTQSLLLSYETTRTRGYTGTLLT